jgi:hypothetical protein
MYTAVSTIDVSNVPAQNAAQPTKRGVERRTYALLMPSSAGGVAAATKAQTPPAKIDQIPMIIAVVMSNTLLTPP